MHIYLQKQIHLNRRRFFLWLPVLLCLGITVYFSLPVEPEVQPQYFFILAFLLVVGWVLTFIIKHYYSRLCALIILSVVSGFVLAYYQTQKSDTEILSFAVKNVQVEAKVLSREQQNKRFMLIVEPTYMKPLKGQNKPKRLRVYGRQAELVHVEAGCHISFSAHIAPIDTPLVDNGYDARLQKYFQQEGGRSFIRNVHQYNCDRSLSLKERIEKFRYNLADRIYKQMPPNTGGIAVALITGIRGKIIQEDKLALRYAGLAHMLAISGMHMALFVTTIYALVRFICVLFPVFVQRWNIRPFCAITALVSGSVYLLLSGGAVATQRAFIMIVLVYLAIILGRNALTMRNVAWAALLVLILQPHSLLLSSFQMSFTAVLSLIAFYEMYQEKRIFSVSVKHFGVVRKFIRWFVLYFIGLALTSIIAGAATGFVAAYHFQEWSNYGLFANLLAVPILGIIIMPSALLAIALMPFGLEKIGLYGMNIGIQAVTDISGYVSSLKGAVWFLSSSPGFILPVFFTGVIFLCLWRGSLRILGILPIIISFLFLGAAPKPDILVYSYGEHIAARQEDGYLQIMSRSKRRFVPQGWLKYEGETDVNMFQNFCKASICFLPSKFGNIAYVNKAKNLEKACKRAKIIIFTRRLRSQNIYRNCSQESVTIFDSSYWRSRKVISLNYNREEGKFEVKAVGNDRDRPWTQ